MRGTPEAFSRLQHKDTDTLYFITSADATDGLLYLGNKLISGDNDKDLTTFSLSQLEDVLIQENLSEKALLVYDEQSKKWISSTPSELVFIGASNSANGIAGLVPAPKQGATNLFLRSDGNWAEIVVNETVVADNNIITVENNDINIVHNELINNAITDLEIAKGDIIIIKDLIADDKYQHTAYVFDGENWSAMDGNYNAENVYFDEDFVFTEKIGTVKTLTNGSATVAAAGKNVKEFLASLFAAETQPTITAPTYSLSATPVLAATAEIGNYINGYNFDGSWSSGSYQYGSKENSSTSTGITPTYVVTENKENQTSNALDGNFTLTNPIQINSTTSKSYATITGECVYEDSPRTPVTNLGNEASAGSLKGKTITKTAEVLVTGYRSSFKYVGEDRDTEIDSDFIRNSINMNGNTKDFGTIIIPKGTQRVVLAVPDGSATLTSVIDIDGMGLDIKSNFTKYVIAVEGANSYPATDYSVFVCKSDSEDGLAATRYTVTIS